MASGTPKILYKIAIYNDAVNSGGTVQVLGPDDKPVKGLALADGLDGLVHIEHIEILTTRDSKGVMRACLHVRCRQYC